MNSAQLYFSTNLSGFRTCLVLYWIVLYCIVSSCIVLSCPVLYCLVFFVRGSTNTRLLPSVASWGYLIFVFLMEVKLNWTELNWRRSQARKINATFYAFITNHRTTHSKLLVHEVGRGKSTLHIEQHIKNYSYMQILGVEDPHYFQCI